MFISVNVAHRLANVTQWGLNFLAWVRDLLTEDMLESHLICKCPLWGRM